jgi:hypothetical protein
MRTLHRFDTGLGMIIGVTLREPKRASHELLTGRNPIPVGSDQWRARN